MKSNFTKKLYFDYNNFVNIFFREIENLGIPTLVIAAASVDDVLAISGFTILLGITFKPDQNIYSTIFQGPKEAIIGLLFGIGKYKIFCNFTKLF